MIILDANNNLGNRSSDRFRFYELFIFKTIGKCAHCSPYSYPYHKLYKISGFFYVPSFWRHLFQRFPAILPELNGWVVHCSGPSINCIWVLTVGMQSAEQNIIFSCILLLYVHRGNSFHRPIILSERILIFYDRGGE